MKAFLLVLVLSVACNCYSQIDSSLISRIKALDTANILRTDTVAVPNDSFTKKIKTLRSEQKGLTLETIIGLKIAEEQQKDTSHSKEFYKKLLDEITTGRTGKLLENSVVNIYRRSFTENEIDELIRFYRTSAGQKMNTEYLLLLVQSVKDAEQLLKMAAKGIEAGGGK
ncbi:MAG TPA: DUF2059 domain-containing protein [Chitinophagaceae bacterium]|nr:DUF2059 domain-containing protein [Chitinophagaceae bacterium]